MGNHRPHSKDSVRVVVTGIGMATPLGVGKETFGARLFAGESAISGIKSFPTDNLPSHLGAEVTDFSPRDFISLKNLRRMDRISQLTTAAARLALDDAGLAVNSGNRDRIGILLGTAFGATDVTVHLTETLIKEGPALVNPIMVPNTVLNAAAGHASIELGFRGVNVTVTHFAVSAETALAYAVAEIRRGAADFILAGGADIISPFYYEALTRFYALSPTDGKTEACRPFDRNRNGMVAGEGCGILCLESLEGARARGRNPYCEITGLGLGSSPTPPTQWPTDPAGIKRTIRRALDNAGIGPEDIHAVSAAANGGRVLDAVEAAAYADIFGDVKANAKDGPAVTSLKGALGESFSGGGIRACALAMSLERGALPPTVGLAEPIGPLAFVRGETKTLPIDYALLAGISFGGTYVYLVFSRYHGEETKP
ncbi:MAG: beta-ketoacyl-[acyl-carrier-protein] synthase family protein [Syntrophales bacterium]